MQEKLLFKAIKVLLKKNMATIRFQLAADQNNNLLSFLYGES